MPTFYFSLSDSIRLQFSQSLLNEDVADMLNAIRSAILARDNGRALSPAFTVQYWGQSEFVRDSQGSGVSFTYWQPIFFVQSADPLATSTGTTTYSPQFDFLVNLTALNTFFTTYNSSRLNFYGSSLAYDPARDYIASDLFLLPCYGPFTFSQSYNIIMQLVQNEWIKYFQAFNFNDVAASLTIQSFPVLSLPYVNQKGYFSVLPFGVRTTYGLMYPEVFSGIDTKGAVFTYCNRL